MYRQLAYWPRAPELLVYSIYLMPKVWYSIKMSGPNSILLCVEHDEASAMYANLTLAVSVICFHAATSTL